MSQIAAKGAHRGPWPSQLASRGMLAHLPASVSTSALRLQFFGQTPACLEPQIRFNWWFSGRCAIRCPLVSLLTGLVVGCCLVLGFGVFFLFVVC